MLIGLLGALVGLVVGLAVLMRHNDVLLEFFWSRVLVRGPEQAAVELKEKLEPLAEWVALADRRVRRLQAEGKPLAAASLAVERDDTARQLSGAEPFLRALQRTVRSRGRNEETRGHASVR